MKKSYFTSILALLVFTLSSLSASAQMEKAGKLKSQIQAMNDKMIKAIKADDHETLSAMYVDDVYSMPSYAPMTTTKQAMIEREMKNQEAGYKMESMKFNVVDVFPAGEYIVEIGTYDITMGMPQMTEPMHDVGKYVTVWQKQKDGSLKIKVETWNSDMNPMEMGNEKKVDRMEKMGEHENGR